MLFSVCVGVWENKGDPAAVHQWSSPVEWVVGGKTLVKGSHCFYPVKYNEQLSGVLLFCSQKFVVINNKVFCVEPKQQLRVREASWTGNYSVSSFVFRVAHMILWTRAYSDGSFRGNSSEFRFKRSNNQLMRCEVKSLIHWYRDTKLEVITEHQIKLLHTRLAPSSWCPCIKNGEW